MEEYTVAMGGTFDRLHPGHEKLLETAFAIGKNVLIGLTTDNLLRAKKHREIIQPYYERKEKLLEFARIHGRDADIEIVPLDDPFGPSVTREHIDAMVCSEETEEMVKRINRIRRRNGLMPVTIVVVPMLLQEDGTRFSSTKLRKKEIKND